MAEQRIKEIGIRKILGASVMNLWRMLSREFIIMIMLSLLISSPITYYFMDNWLQNYQYRTALSLWIFITVGGGLMVITLFTVSFQAIKAALANPVNSLKSE
jgi:putative ABC transport system permease protein